MVLFRAAPRRGPILNGAALAPYKCFGRGAKPWRRADSFRPRRIKRGPRTRQRVRGGAASPHGLGFERMVMYLTGVSNIRDVELHPRTVGNADF